MTSEEKLDFLVDCFSELRSDVSDLKSDVSYLKSDVSELKSDVSYLKSDVSGLKSDVSELKTNFSELEHEVRNIRITLENVTNKNIQIIAEGHLHLNDRLDELVKPNHEKELLMIRVNVLEDEVKRLKERISA